MTSKEIKIAVFAAAVMGTAAAMEGKPRVPHHNKDISDYLRSLPIQEMSTNNLKIASKILKSFADNYTMQILKSNPVN